jgi:Aerotolerance regulator N-terminal/von Willebrand factor type A domain
VPITFLNAMMLAGLAAIALPPIIHLLTRKKFDIAPWGAMQFLDLGKRARRRLVWDEWFLMAIRMAVIGILVLALAAPTETAGWLAHFRARGARDIVLILDHSSSMGVGMPSNAGQQWAMALIDELGPSDRLAVIRAGTNPKIISPMSADHDGARSAVQTLSPPRGGCDGPAAVAMARELLVDSRPAERSIVIVTDGQRYGWADEAATQHWDVQRPAGGDCTVSIARLAADRRGDLPRWALDPLKTSRALAVVNHPMTVRTELRRLGSGELTEPMLRWEIDRQSIGSVEPLAGTANASARPIALRRALSSAGSHLITLRLLAADQTELDRQDLAIEVVPHLPVLVIDGDERSGPWRHGVEFLREALAPARDPTPSVVVRVVPTGNFVPAMLTRDLAGPGTPPRVLILADVPRLTTAQSAAIEQFLSTGGGVLVALGDRADAEYYTSELFRDTRGWLPVAVGPQAGPGDPLSAPSPLVSGFQHPALELFRNPGAGTLAEARMPRWRTLTILPNTPAAGIARLSGDIPLFVETTRGNGRVIVSAIPLDDSNRTNLVELPAFAPLIHELIAYLGSARTADSNVPAGQPIRWEVPKSAPAEGWSLSKPDGTSAPIAVDRGRITIDGTHEPGVYALSHAKAPPRYFVVASDPNERDLTPLGDSDRERLGSWLPGLRWVNNSADALAPATAAKLATELNWLAFVGVIALLCFELWMTRRRALAAA